MDNVSEEMDLKGGPLCENYSSVFNIIMQYLSVIFV